MMMAIALHVVLPPSSQAVENKRGRADSQKIVLDAENRTKRAGICLKQRCLLWKHKVR